MVGTQYLMIRLHSLCACVCRCDVTTLSGCNDWDTHDRDTRVLCRQRKRLADWGTFVVLVYRAQLGYIFLVSDG